MSKTHKSAEDRKAAEAATAAYKDAKWTFLVRMTDRGGGKGKMVRGG